MEFDWKGSIPLWSPTILLLLSVRVNELLKHLLKLNAHVLRHWFHKINLVPWKEDDKTIQDTR